MSGICTHISGPETKTILVSTPTCYSLGFYAEIQLLFGTVYTHYITNCKCCLNLIYRSYIILTGSFKSEMYNKHYGFYKYLKTAFIYYYKD